MELTGVVRCAEGVDDGGQTEEIEERSMMDSVDVQRGWGAAHGSSANGCVCSTHADAVTQWKKSKRQRQSRDVGLRGRWHGSCQCDGVGVGQPQQRVVMPRKSERSREWHRIASGNQSARTRSLLRGVTPKRA
jgi:hypothetical protein